MPYSFTNKDTGKAFGTVTNAQFAQLQELLEEEGEGDRDYYIDRDMLEYLEDEGCDAELVTLLRNEMGDDEGVEIEWSES